MTRLLKFVLVGLSVMSSCTIAPVVASAQELQLRVGPDGVGVYDRNREREDYDRREPRRGCNPDEALEAARDEGLRRVQIVRVSPRSIVVQGDSRRGPERMTFANRRGCPEL
jgi:hypothetical protein